MYELYGHTADLGMRVVADSLEQLLLDAADGFRAMVLPDSSGLAGDESIEVAVPASTERLDDLLFDWLSELLLLFETEHFLAQSIELHIDGWPSHRTSQGSRPDTDAAASLTLRATLRGQRIDPDQWRLEHEVKAVTYHQLELCHRDGQWQGNVIVDI
ncbi:MAG: archease [Planctomycetales bacterium]|nr:archease [Planctomycetales bacterium]